MMKLYYLMLSMILVVAVLCCSCLYIPIKNSNDNNFLEDNENCSVSIKAGDYSGSGVLFKNKNMTFVWSDAHVIEGVKCDSNGVCGYSDLLIGKSIVINGRRVGDNLRLAKVIRFSKLDDVAVLCVYEPNYGEKSVKWSTTLPNRGDAIWHVGSFKGMKGAESVSDGVVASLGRLRKDFMPNEFNSPKIFDQISGTIHPGSSGGGIFRKDNGDCLGLVTEFLDVNSFGSYCINPSRRILEFAKRTNCMWAYSHEYKSPAFDNLEVITED